MKYYYIAQAYGTGNYGQNTYTGETTATGSGSTGTSGAGSANGDLANTGIYVLAIVSLACFLIFLALTIRLIRRKKAVRNMNLPVVIPGQHPVDTQVQSADQATSSPAPAPSIPETEKPRPTKRIDF